MLHDRTALTLGVAQSVATTAISAAVFVLAGWTHAHNEAKLLLWGAIAYWPSMFAGSFLGVALCAAAAAALDGRHLTLREALSVSVRRLGQIFVWSLLATGVGLLLEQLAARVPFGGKLVTWLAGMAWSLGTLLVLPIIALDGCMADECVRRSARLVKERWGEGVTGSLAIGAWGVVLAIPLAIVAVIVSAATHSRTATLAVYLPALILVGSLAGTASRVFSVALYRFATSGTTDGPFPASDLERPFRKKRRGKS
jgi:hypothetical protein